MDELETLTSRLQTTLEGNVPLQKTVVNIDFCCIVILICHRCICVPHMKKYIAQLYSQVLILTNSPL